VTPEILLVAGMPMPAPQGSPVYALGMARALAAVGTPVAVAAWGHGRGAWPDGVARVSAPSPPALRTLRSGPDPRRPALDALLLGALVARLARGRVIALHAHHVEGLAVAWAARKLTGARVPLLWTPHTLLGEELPDHLARALGPLGARFGALADHRLPELADGAVALSRRSAAWLRARVPTAVAPPALDLESLDGGDATRARQRGSLGDGAWVLYTGNADAYQDLPVLFEAMAQLPEAGLLVASEAPRARFEALARDARLPLGRLRVVPGDLGTLRDAAAAAFAAAVPRRRCAGFPIKLLNTLAAGLPTVCARGAAQPVEGVVPVADGDPGAMAGALRALLADRAGARRLGDAARRAVRARHGLVAGGQALRAAYAALGVPLPSVVTTAPDRVSERASPRPPGPAAPRPR
jgi:glycosyltransferase involved in cell wall biosynthesis